MPAVKYKCKFCGREFEAKDMDVNQSDIPAYCPHCGKVMWDDMNQYAILVAEHLGIYEFDVNGDWIEYWSFFSGEGFVFVQYDMVTGREFRDGFIPITFGTERPMPKFLGHHYNYRCG